MDFHILGPLEVLDEDRAITLAGSRQRALLGVLLLHANETLSTDRLIDELWGEHPPPTATKAVHVHISRLRKALVRKRSDNGNGHGVVVTREHGLRAHDRPRAPRRAPVRAAARRGPQRAGGRPPGARGRGS
jgi:DNA-binding SARP family transcriptional activator